MKIMTARTAKNCFGVLIDTALAEPVTIEKHGRPVVVVMNMEEYERLFQLGSDSRMPSKEKIATAGGRRDARIELKGSRILPRSS
jgi:prevent-host-death family protein